MTPRSLIEEIYKARDFLVTLDFLSESMEHSWKREHSLTAAASHKSMTPKRLLALDGSGFRPYVSRGTLGSGMSAEDDFHEILGFDHPEDALRFVSGLSPERRAALDQYVKDGAARARADARRMMISVMVGAAVGVAVGVLVWMFT